MVRDRASKKKELVRAVVLIVVACGVAACSSSEEHGSQSSNGSAASNDGVISDHDAGPAIEAEVTPGSDELAGVVDGPVISVAGPPRNSVEQALIEGTLERDGDCLYVVNDEFGSKHALIWLFGTTWDEATEEVVGLNGDRAKVGESLSSGGGYGTPEHYESLLVGDGLVERAVECVVGEFRELAYVQDRFSSE